ncbi:hypothetical protein HMPREF0063_12827 [Aeromicrobium marinum DSM 15272]|uniref:N-acetyltransferase domain-containing protein n=2 Tax=Aeromicrobium marinum TaxID=219314 RepID=E2SFL8_9ACTN|nr:hypothetical protein HMPREF0063_12827 [Aeromicrobium marinum DSM 15272]
MVVDHLMTDTPEVRRNDDAGRYEILADGQVAGYTEFRADGDVLTFPHTVVESAFEGRGLAGTLVAEALDDVRRRGQKIVPTCAYVRHFVEKHPEYADLVA